VKYGHIKKTEPKSIPGSLSAYLKRFLGIE
jgi:hypothetical protein